jgi:mitofusin
MSGLLPAEKKQVSLNILPRREPFEILYRLNCDNLCADFHEDLEFRFSWGLTSIISRFAGKKANSLALTNCSQRVSVLYIIVSVGGIGLVSLFILFSCWHIYVIICCDFDTNTML